MGKILIAEDVEFVSLQLKKILLQLNEIILSITKSTDDTLHYLSRDNHEVDILFISDSLTAGNIAQDSLELVKKLIENHPTLKVIVITTHESKQTILKFISNGVKGYVEKPLSIDKIQKVLSEVTT